MMMPRSVLVYAPSWIGDAVMSLGALRALRQSYPGARLSVLTRPWVQDLYDGCGVVDDAIQYDPRGVDRGARGFMRAARQVLNALSIVALEVPRMTRLGLGRSLSLSHATESSSTYRWWTLKWDRRHVFSAIARLTSARTPSSSSPFSITRMCQG